MESISMNNKIVFLILLFGNLTSAFELPKYPNPSSRDLNEDLGKAFFQRLKSLNNARESPPDAITDLRLIATGSIPSDILVANLKWTAPSLSPETPNTKVDIYEIKYSLSEDDLLSNFDACLDAPLLNAIQTVPPGEEVSADIYLPDGVNVQFFLAARAVGIDNLKGDLSNIVYTVVKPNEPTTEPTSTSTESTTTRTTLSLEPPEKILDLKLESLAGDVPTNLYSRLMWTAPSASPETPDDPVEIYEIKYSLTEQELSEQFENCLDAQMVNNASIQPVAPGETVTADVFIFFGENKVFYMAIRAIGTYGAKGEVSNIVQTTARSTDEPPNPTTTTKVTTTASSLLTSSENSFQTTTIETSSTFIISSTPPTKETETTPIANKPTTAPSILSAGAIIGISIGGAALISILAILIFCIYFNKKSKNLKEESIYQPTYYREPNYLPPGAYPMPNEPQLIPRPAFTQPMQQPPPPPPKPKNTKKSQQQPRGPY